MAKEQGELNLFDGEAENDCDMNDDTESGSETDETDDLPIGDGGPAYQNMRTDAWLEDRMRTIIRVHYPDLPSGYPIVIRFGIRARYRFGSIAARNGKTIILINRLFALEEVPAFVVDGTIAHELAHYVHGFGSGLPKRYSDPHRGGVVDKELAKRGLAPVEEAAEVWRKANWEAVYSKHCGDIEYRKNVTASVVDIIWAERVTNVPGCRDMEELRKVAHRMFQRIGAGQGEPVFAVEWLNASLRQTGTSYWFAANKTVKLHGLLADRRVPDYVIEFELAYWAMRTRGVAAWPTIHQFLINKGMQKTVEQALLWRQQKWNAFRTRNHPLRPKSR